MIQLHSITQIPEVELRAIVNRVTARWKREAPILLTDTFAGLPKAIHDAARDDGSDGSNKKGVLHDESIYVVRLVVKENRNGPLHYDHDLLGEVAPETVALGDTAETGRQTKEPSGGSMKIGVLLDGVKDRGEPCQ